jgi:hypothetical protein
MRIKLAVSGLALALALVPVAAAQQPPDKPKNQPKPPTGVPALTIGAKPAPIVFSGTTTLSGRLSGTSSDGGTVIRLEQDDSRPYGDSYKPAGAVATTANNGNYTFALKPLLNTQYRVVAQASPPVTSPAKLVLVRTLVGFKLADQTPRRGALVTFSGSVFPAHDGRPVSIQKRSPSGSFITVSRTTLRDAGTAKSTYSRRLRIFRDGVYRVKVAGDADHINGFSSQRTVTVHG